MAKPLDQFLLFGDSITQRAHCQELGFAWAAALQDDYTRRLDVINRGFSGYNTDQALRVINSAIPHPQYAALRFLTVFFGANDACWPTESDNQSVPLPQFSANLIKILTHPVIKAHKDVRIVVITPPPIDEYMTWMVDVAKGYAAPRRTAEHTKQYADAAHEVGKDLNIPVLDLWTLMMLKAGWNGGSPLPGSRELPENMALREMLTDGLHLSPAGYRVLHEDLNDLIERFWPDQAPASLPFVLPCWNNAAAWKEFNATI